MAMVFNKGLSHGYGVTEDLGSMTRQLQRVTVGVFVLGHGRQVLPQA